MNLSTTKRCYLFDEIATIEWNHIIRNHSTNTGVSEIGITKDIISIIRSNSNQISNLGVWANSGANKKLYGSDIDIFVEFGIGNFIWYALQAKALQEDGTYQDMDRFKNGEYQWEKLYKLQKSSNCITRYLLYNGVSGYSYIGRDLCARQFTQTQFGCSLVSPKKVEEICKIKKKPTFLDFHPTHAHPWRVIVCCIKHIQNTTLYTLPQIQKAVAHYPVKPEATNILTSNNLNEQKPEDSTIDKINTISQEVGWTPQYRVVIRTTAGLNST